MVLQVSVVAIQEKTSKDGMTYLFNVSSQVKVVLLSRGQGLVGQALHVRDRELVQVRKVVTPIG